MDCLEAQAILSAAHDGEPVAAGDLDSAKEHCEDCDDCATFAAGLRYLDVMPAPTAPPAVVDATLSAVVAAAAERAETERLAALRLEAEAQETEVLPAEPATEPAAESAASQRFPWLTEPMKWGGLGAIAATVLIAIVLMTTSLGSNSGSRTASTRQVATTVVTAGGSVSSATTSTATTTNQSPATAPDYVSYGGLVYSPGALLADSDTATPAIGTVSTAFASTNAAEKVTVYTSPLADGSIVVVETDGYRLYSPVVRLLASKRYQLAAGNALERFGVWPTLPARFTAPTSSDGSPTFTAAGTDALGVNIYTVIGQPVTSGFAVAPVTSTSDPAGGNPNWTWWEPVS
jgi:hypothetical protein